MTSLAESFFEASIRTATPLALAALGETVVERAGIINIGLEGVILAGAFGALVGGFLPPELHANTAAVLGGSSVAAGYTLAIFAGVLTAAIFALFTVSLKGDQIIAGTAINLLVLGSTGTLYRTLYGTSGAALSIQTSGSVEISILSAIPLIGPALFAQPLVTYALYLLIPVIWWMLYRTHAGLALRAVGENPEAAIVAGVSVIRTRWTAILMGGALGGAAGGALVLAQSGTFAEGMSAGRGFIAIAIVVLGRWHPIGAAAAAVLFGAASAIQFVIQARGWAVPYQLPLALPYLLTLGALALGGFRLGARRHRAMPTGAPAALGRAE